MKRKISWRGLDTDTIETCTIDLSENEILIQSVIKSKHQPVDIHCEYQIRTNASWVVKSFDVTYSYGNVNRRIYGLRNDTGWIINGKPHEDFNNCVDIDITLTPFTNSLPINRLTWELNKPMIIEVVYLDVLENVIRVAKQQYTRKSETSYNFQNVPNDFEADIIVDNEGFVVHYPNLFERKDG